MDGDSTGPQSAQSVSFQPERWSSASGEDSDSDSDSAEPEPEPEPEAHSSSLDEEDAAAVAERQRWLRARSMEWKQARAILSRRSSEEAASGSESGGGSSMSDVFSSSAGGGPPLGNRMTSESESDWSSAHEGFFVETAGDIARMRILELQHKGVDLPAYTAVSTMHRHPRRTHTSVGGGFGATEGTQHGGRGDSGDEVASRWVTTTPAECGACGPAGEHTTLSEHRHAGRPRRRAKVLSKEQKQLKRLRRRKRELEAMVSIIATANTLLRSANAVLLCAVYTDSAWDT
jgi:hypothetical protein